jgi:hypothetical protein
MIYAGRMVADATYLYVLNSLGRIERVPLAGGPTVRLLDFFSLGMPRDMYVDGEALYLSYGVYTEIIGSIVTGSLGVARIRLSDLQTTTLYSRPVFLGQDLRDCSPPAMVLDGASVFYSAADRPESVPPIGRCPGTVAIEAVPAVGGAYSTLTAANPRLSSVWGLMASDGNRVYYSDDNGLSSVPIGGGTPTLHVSALFATNMVVRDGYLYLNNAGSLQRYRLSDFAVTVIAPNGVGDIAVDDVAVYWTHGGATNEVKKAPK